MIQSRPVASLGFGSCRKVLNFKGNLYRKAVGAFRRAGKASGAMPWIELAAGSCTRIRLSHGIEAAVPR